MSHVYNNEFIRILYHFFLSDKISNREEDDMVNKILR